MYKISYFFRHPQPTYFSIEKLFKKIADQVANNYSSDFITEENYMPFTSSLKTILKNILFTKKKQLAINHITGDVHYAILGCSSKNINILTVHDCVALHRYSHKNPRHWVIKLLWFDLPVKKADIVTVISENTKAELIHVTKCSADKIKVIGNFVDPSFQYAPFIFNDKIPRILFIGTTPNKNFERLVEALKEIPCVLDIIGQLTSAQIQKLKKNQINYIQSEKLNDEALLVKYRECDLVAFPSTYEGFGLPILEAQATGRPVLTSNLSPMKDVAGAAACLVDPYNEDSIKEGLLQVINNAGYRKKLVELGLENVKQFRINSIADQYANLYMELFNKKKEKN